MPRFQRYGFPFQYYRPYNYNYRPRTPACESAPTPKDVSTPSPESSPSLSSNKHQKPPAPVWLDLFGIKLYFDDVLILSLLFFLYKEEVKDEGLFLALVLLLIS